MLLRDTVISDPCLSHIDYYGEEYPGDKGSKGLYAQVCCLR